MKSYYNGSLDKSSKRVICVVAGGSGTRFWPLSRKSKPKQFLSLDGKRSLIQQTVDRLAGLVDNNLLVVTAASQISLVNEHLPKAATLAEPMPKNTAPALVYAAMKILEEVGDVPIVCLPADHIIENLDQLNEILTDAFLLAESEDLLITIGLKPTAPETGFGYIKRGGQIDSPTSNQPYQIAEFVEKPDKQTAQRYLASGDYYWNSGMFVWRPSVLINAANKHLPDISTKLRQAMDCFSKDNELDQISKIFSELESISIDYGVMEKAENVALFVADDLAWSDVGAWDAWSEVAAGSRNVIQINSENSYVSSSKQVVLVGLDDVVVVDTDDALLVCKKDQAQKVKDVVERLKSEGKEELL